MRSAKLFTSAFGSQPARFAQSSQKGEPVSGEKCQATISRTCASSFSRAVSIAWAATESADMVQVWGRVRLYGYSDRRGLSVRRRKIFFNCGLGRGPGQ